MTVNENKAEVWNDALLADPHAAPDKRRRVQQMFAAIAPSYDLNNRLHSLWMDQRWRRKAVKLARIDWTDRIIDVACGTGDLTRAFMAEKQRLHPEKLTRWPRELDSDVIGIDFTYEMLPVAQRKARRNEWDSPLYVNGDALSLPLSDGSADVLSIAFGIRNVSDPAAAVREFHRVLRPGGRLIILEFSLPSNRVLRALYNLYFRKVLPRTATLISRDRTGAYKYLPESVNTFISPASMMGMMSAAGFANVEQHPLTFGICICYRGVKT